MDYPGKVITKNQVTPTQTSATGVWTLDDAAAATRNNNWPVALVPNPISKSLRFNSADSAYLNRTPASASNRRTWTWSGWVKRSALGTGQYVLDAGTGPNTFLLLGAGNTLTFADYTSGPTYNLELITTQVLRDVSAWYHIVIAVDTTQATSTNRVKIYLNGSQITAFGTATYPSQNFDTGWNNATAHRIGSTVGGTNYTNAYLTEINFIDGQALTPSSFGMTNPQTGQWIPLKYSGTYGTNGFYLNFKDATSTTTLGYDYSGNANNWTTNNFSVTAGVGNDSMTDVPTPWFAYNTTGDVGGVIRGNYATLNPLDVTGTITVSNGNLQATASSDANTFTVRGTFGVSSGSWYWECVKLVTGDTGASFGIMSLSQAISGAPTGCYGIRDDGNKVVNGSYSAFGSSFTTATVGLAFNATSGTLEIFLNNVSQGTISSIPAGTYAPFISDTSTGAGTNAGGIANFGQRPFAYTPPSGFLSLCTTNLPASTIVAGNQYFDVKTWSGNSSTQSIALNFAPDLIWNKSRGDAAGHSWWDVIRGTGAQISSNQTDAETTGYNAITSFSNNAISLGVDNTGTYNGRTNETGRTYVGWVWKANGAGVSNTAGTITSTVSANTTSGFSIVTYTGTGTSSETVGHGLGVAPKMIIVKNRTTGSTNWPVWHTSLTNETYTLYMDTTLAQGNTNNPWGSGTISSTTFHITATGTGNSNQSSANFVAYCFAAISGFSAFGSYTGNGSTDGPFVYTGFRPRFVMVKRTDSSGNNWTILDTSRDTYNAAGLYLYPNLSAAEDDYRASTGPVDILSNGFKQRSALSNVNASGATYIYACFAENPFKNALAR